MRGQFAADTNGTERMIANQDKGREFLALHQSKPGFVMPNAWDAGSAVLLAKAGFAAIATTSAGIAFSLGKPDYQTGDGSLAVSRDEMFARMRQIVDAVRVPVNGDLEAGYGDTPEAVAETIRLAMEIGLAGGNIEDRVPGEVRLFEAEEMVARIRAARAAIDKAGGGFVLNARCDAFQMANGAHEAIRRGNLYRAAGADCIFTPGPGDVDTVATLVRKIDAPLNIVAGLGSVRLDPKTLLAAGVQRVSLGGSIARAALGFVVGAARELREHGTIGFAAGQIPQPELNAIFTTAQRAAGQILR